MNGSGMVGVIDIPKTLSLSLTHTHTHTPRIDQSINQSINRSINHPIETAKTTTTTTGGEIASTFDHPELVKLGECDLIEEVSPTFLIVLVCLCDCGACV
jgi:hypothetical protein